MKTSSSWNCRRTSLYGNIRQLLADAATVLLCVWFYVNKFMPRSVFSVVLMYVYMYRERSSILESKSKYHYILQYLHRPKKYRDRDSLKAQASSNSKYN